MDGWFGLHGETFALAGPPLNALIYLMEVRGEVAGIVAELLGRKRRLVDTSCFCLCDQLACLDLHL